jgi:hemerythrin superfamily protein
MQHAQQSHRTQHGKHQTAKHHAAKHQPAARARKSVDTAKQHDVLSILSEDHRRVQELFKQFEKMRTHKNGEDKMKELVTQICVELTVHSKVEEEVFYPVAREVIKDQEITDEAYVEHAGAKELIQQLQSMKPGDEYYDAKVIVLEEYINHHIKEEEEKIFPAMKKAKVDLDEIGEQIIQRKEELKADAGEISMSMLSKA